MAERIYTCEEKRTIENIKATQKHICRYCGKEITEQKDVTVDHCTPVSRGGKTVKDNLVICCESCNIDKDNMTEQEYLAYRRLQKEAQDTYEVVKDINEIIKLQNKVISKIEKTKRDYEKVNKTIETIQENIMLDNFNASEGYIYSRNLKEMLLIKTDMDYVKEGYKPLHMTLGNQKEKLSTLMQSISENLYSMKRPLLKKIVKNEVVSVKNNIIDINSLKQAIGR